MLMALLYWENCINVIHYSGEISVMASKYIGVVSNLDKTKYRI
jgi:hypothetical protein